MKILQLNPEQKPPMLDYQDKWRAIALSTEPIEHQRASRSVRDAYAAIGLPEPEIIFFDSPYGALKKPPNLLASFAGSFLRGKIEKGLGIQPGSQLGSIVESHLESEAIDRVKKTLWTPLTEQLGLQFGKALWTQLRNELGSQNDNCIQPELWACYAAGFDYCISVLNCQYEPTQWEVLQSVVRECGWIFPWKKTCWVCDRPRQISFDRQQRLHREGAPAIQYSDGFSVYAERGVVIPQKY